MINVKLTILKTNLYGNFLFHLIFEFSKLNLKAIKIIKMRNVRTSVSILAKYIIFLTKVEIVVIKENIF